MRPLVCYIVNQPFYRSYLNNPEATRAAFTDDGFYRTGDVAHMDGDEFIFDGRVSTDCKWHHCDHSDAILLTRQQLYRCMHIGFQFWMSRTQ
jgi:hypothetical protein